MRKYNKWQTTQATNSKGKNFSIYLCAKCKKGTVVQTTYCAHCGKRMIRGGK